MFYIISAKGIIRSYSSKAEAIKIALAINRKFGDFQRVVKIADRGKLIAYGLNPDDPDNWMDPDDYP